MIPGYTSVRKPKDGTLPGSIRQTYGRKALSNRERVGHGSGWGHAGDRFGSASEVSLRSMLPCTALRLAAPNGVQSERNIGPVEVQTRYPSHPEGDPVRRWSAGRPLTARDWFEFSGVLVRQLFAIASAFFRSVAEGLSKASRTIVEQVSKDCRSALEGLSNSSRTSLEQQSKNHVFVPMRRP
ncbi:hypothetical protein [Parapedobacter soli]|uniref:hypothetical protein n=1 Tax=Parapedobacter soli TaxID=416955 RepID=UPI0021CAC545|nr:hypothetical protein [Parapedobacter soli]